MCCGFHNEDQMGETVKSKQPRQRSRLERVLLVVTPVLVATIILLSILLALVAWRQNQPPHSNNLSTKNLASYDLSSTSLLKEPLDSSTCLSISCIHTASEIIKSLDETQNPCENFYEFSCGGWMRNNPLPEGKSSWGVFSKIEQQNQLVIRSAIEKVDMDDKNGAEYKAKVFYDACMDINENTRRLAEKPLLDVIYKLGGWHLLDNTKDRTVEDSVQDFDLQVLLPHIQNRYNVGGLFNWAVTEDDRYPSTHVIVLDQGGLHLPSRDYYLDKTAHATVLDAYLKYMTRVCVLLGANETEAKEEMSRVLRFETDLAAITVPAQERRDEEILYNPFSIQQWQKEVGFLNWKEFFDNAFKLVGKSISANERIVSYAPEYFRKLNLVIKKYTSTEDKKKPAKTLKSYLIWQACRSLLPYLSESFRDATKTYRTALFGNEGVEEPWRRCVLETNTAMGFAVSALFVREAFPGEAKTRAELMMDNIRNAFRKNLKNLDWMDSETREAAKNKDDAIINMIGYPDYILNKEELNKQYEELVVKPNEYFKNNLRLNLFSLKNDLKKLRTPVDRTKWGYPDYILNKEELNKQYEELVVKPNEYFKNNLRLNLFSLKNDLKKLRTPVDRTKWGIAPTTVNAYNNQLKNQITFSAGILQPPLFSSENPGSVNYGAMGSIMGHELTHAFDANGREFDGSGNLNQWWNNATINRFRRRAECIREQYSEYSVHGRRLNGRQALDENIADNGGLTTAFQAYLDYSRKAKVNITLPGLKYNHRQLFFIAFGQAWCSSMTKAVAEAQIVRDSTSIPKYRVIGPLSNLREFSNEFYCPVGTRMNPKHKCELW